MVAIGNTHLPCINCSEFKLEMFWFESRLPYLSINVACSRFRSHMFSMKDCLKIPNLWHHIHVATQCGDCRLALSVWQPCLDNCAKDLNVRPLLQAVLNKWDIASEFLSCFFPKWLNHWPLGNLEIRSNDILSVLWWYLQRSSTMEIKLGVHLCRRMPIDAVAWVMCSALGSLLVTWCAVSSALPLWLHIWVIELFCLLHLKSWSPYLIYPDSMGTFFRRFGIWKK